MIAVRAAAVGAALALAIWARRRTASDRLVAMVAGAILCSPYAMLYDMAALMPVAVTALFSETFFGLLMGLPLIGFGPITVPLMAAAAVGRDVHHRRKEQRV